MTEQKKPTTKKARPAKAPAKALRITLTRSPIGTTYRHRATIIALGLRRLHQTVEQADTPQLRGMLAKVGHMVSVEATAGKEKPA
jgi:large subunit ribosomal protein L30